MKIYLAAWFVAGVFISTELNCAQPVEKQLLKQGEQAYKQECAICHQGFNTGAIMLAKRLGKQRAELDKRTELVAPYIKHVVRHGLGSMPAISRVEVTEQQLDAISVYLTRNNSDLPK